MENLKSENIEKIKDILKYTDYSQNLGGEFNYSGYMKTYKRNKRNIKQYLKYDGKYFELYENISGYYNKALIYKEVDKNNYILLSYETVVAEYTEGKMLINGYYSRTTSNHINTFLHKFNYKSMSKKEIEKIEGKIF